MVRAAEPELATRCSKRSGLATSHPKRSESRHKKAFIHLAGNSQAVALSSITHKGVEWNRT